MTKVAIIGNGIIAKSHLEAYNLLAEEGFPVEVVAVCDIRPTQLEGFEKYRTYTDINELLECEKGKVDYVDICLPTFLHASAAISAMEAGYNVLCEKPMALNYEEASKMCQTAKATGKKLMVAHSFRFSPIFRVIREYVEKEIFGKVITATFKRDRGTPKSKVRWNDWLLKEEYSGGAILDLHVHDINALQALFGVPEAVSTGALKIIPGDGYDILSSNFYYKSGLFIHSTAGWVTENNKYFGETKRVDFEHGYIISSNVRGKKIFVAVAEDGTITDLTPEDKYSGYYYEIKYYVDCLRKGIPFDYCTPESSADTIRIAMAETKSAQLNGEKVFLK